MTRQRIPFPSHGGDWRFDPRTGQLVDASQAPAEVAQPAEVPAAEVPAGLVAELSSDTGAPSEPALPLAADEEWPPIPERTAEPGEALPEINPVRRSKRRNRKPQE